MAGLCDHNCFFARGKPTYSVPTLGPILGAALRTSRNPCFRFYRSHARLSFSSEWSLSARREQVRHNAPCTMHNGQCTMHNAEVTLQNPAERTMSAMYIVYTSQQNQSPGTTVFNVGQPCLHRTGTIHNAEVSR